MTNEVTGFDANLFRTLFNRLYLFSDYVDGEMNSDEIDDLDPIKDNFTSKDITDCLRLSIFPMLKNIDHWGENIDVQAYHETKKEGEVVDVRGVLMSGMDWHDYETPLYFYEFAYISIEGGADEFVIELHMDVVVSAMYKSFDNGLPFEEKGSDKCRTLLEKVIENSTDLTDNIRKYYDEELKSQCIIQNDDFEVWKVGVYNGNYQLFMMTPDHISILSYERLLNQYVDMESTTETPKLQSYGQKSLGKITLAPDAGFWYHKGVIDVDSERTEKIKADSENQNLWSTAQSYFNNILDTDFMATGFDVTKAYSPEIVLHYSPVQMAAMIVSGIATDERKEKFGTPFIRACDKHNQDTYHKARELIRKADHA
ncbi:hypothetical protein HN695_06620 [Candidatus Woesearchaeota archaeon]|jgi:hypothetical protein|nr:hypothetical protein [Candidatus Woesearchaeota archaeon]MBT5271832.1 hypothetical protein [Candidatus Woesearchaeota archaeon]MBT6040732.1 hypothetical protein [Candidatus Woesearchaeota archaeon]MBT6337453.1 hypothetical protein [Candidatus Woesearchaeota archaeon]MBT7927979.1 hypothetical protein [Candidatus Woesearchaeota archaeon]